ncbi:hypothetical protein OIU78_018265 [Salix suchowensis]|nr:hypothetical protein OIU78_018265 [Salix suchowensis]
MPKASARLESLMGGGRRPTGALRRSKHSRATQEPQSLEIPRSPIDFGISERRGDSIGWVTICARIPLSGWRWEVDHGWRKSSDFALSGGGKWWKKEQGS